MTVAIFSKEALPELQAALSAMTTPQRAEALRPMLEQVLSGKELQVGVIDIDTGLGTGPYRRPMNVRVQYRSCRIQLQMAKTGADELSRQGRSPMTTRWRL